MRFQSYINTALLILQGYNGQLPFAHYLKQYFSMHKKHGSTDRKLISHACYCWFRTGQSLRDVESMLRIKTALFLCMDEAGAWASLFDTTWLEHWPTDMQERVAFVEQIIPSFNIINIFEWNEALSKSIDQQEFTLSHLVQPDLFIRIRPGYEKKVPATLTRENISFSQLNTHCLALPNATKVESILMINKEIVIQDYSSQRVGELMAMLPDDNKPMNVWDCCAASGGKSILAKDILNHIVLTASDIRLSIIHNLKQRFTEAGIKQYKAVVADAGKPLPIEKKYQLIICDAPCSGSGTWGRTPEQLSYFKTEKIDEYASLQKKIAGNVVAHLETGGYLLYITCSVFEKENEEVVDDICNNHPVELVESRLLHGYDLKADTMFAALFKRR